MSEEDNKEKYMIVIPDKVEYTKLLQCPVDPPHDKMSITFTTKGEDEPFREGKIVNRRCPEIAGFMFRPMKIDRKTKARVKPLQDGDIVTVKVTLYNKSEPTKRILSEPIQSLTQDVLITDEKTKNKPKE